MVVAGGNEGELYPSKRTPGLTTPAPRPSSWPSARRHERHRELLDDGVASFSQIGEKKRKPDVVAPGSRVASLRVPGSKIDELYGGVATEDDRFIRGSGTRRPPRSCLAPPRSSIQQRPTTPGADPRPPAPVASQKLDKVYPEYQGTGELTCARR